VGSLEEEPDIVQAIPLISSHEHLILNMFIKEIHPEGWSKGLTDHHAVPRRIPPGRIRVIFLAAQSVLKGLSISM